MTSGNDVPANLRGGPWNNFGKYRKLLYKYHELSEYQFTALDWGGNDAQCIKFDPLVKVPFDFTALDPELQSAKEKQQYRIRAEMKFQIITNNVPKKYFELYMMESDSFLFTDNSTRDEIGDGVILLKIIIDDIKPITVIDVQDLEEKLASATFRKYENNILYCTRDMEKLCRDIRRLKPATYKNIRFLTQLFRTLETTTNDSSEIMVETVKDKWILGDATCMLAYVIKTCNTKYRIF